MRNFGWYAGDIGNTFKSSFVALKKYAQVADTKYMKLVMRNSVIIFIVGLILTGLLVGFTVEQNIVEDSSVRADPDAENWDIDALDTAKDADYLTGIEKDVVLETNMARSDPKKYAELYIQPKLQYFKGKRYAEPGQAFVSTVEGTTVVEECVAEMSKMEPVGILTPEKGLSLSAKDHAIDQGKTGETGHVGSDKSDPFDRIERYADSLSTAGENIAYGPTTGHDIVVQFLIDDGVPDRSHRVNLLKSDFTQAGIAFGTHPKFRAMCAITYAADYKIKEDNAIAQAPVAVDTAEPATQTPQASE
jgi:uncharacterized protein YkwD